MAEQTNLSTTPLHAYHEANAKNIEPFGGWLMPMLYTGERGGVIKEHLATRSGAGIFDVSHMGRLLISGDGALSYLQNVTTNNVAQLNVGEAQYTFIQNEEGCALDDAYLYRTGDREYMLVVNAGNTLQDIAWLRDHQPQDARLDNITEELAMISLQGPASPEVFAKAAEELGIEGRIGKGRNTYDVMGYNGSELFAARTGYTGEPRGNEFFVRSEDAPEFWEVLIEQGAVPVGLGARDTLRLEAGLPLYGHELTPSDPIMSVGVGKIGVSFAPEKGNYIGRLELSIQAAEREDIRLQGANYGVPLDDRVLKTIVRPMAGMKPDLSAPGGRPPRAGYGVFLNGEQVGVVTSGTSVPSLEMSSQDIYAEHTDEVITRPIALARLDSTIFPSRPGKNRRRFEIRPGSGRSSDAIVVASNMRATTQYTHPVIHPESYRAVPDFDSTEDVRGLMRDLVIATSKNTTERQRHSINLIPSETTPSALVRELSISDPMGRYAEYRQLRALGRDSPDVKYYEGTGFAVDFVEASLRAALAHRFDVHQVETRSISGQQAVKAIYSGVAQWFNRALIKGGQPMRMRSVMTNSLGDGGHLSHQYFGGLRDYVQIDPSTGRPAVHNFVPQQDNPLRIDVERSLDRILEVRPEMMVFGGSLILHPQPVREITQGLEAELGYTPISVYDAAHVLELLNVFQNPLAEGAHFLASSTHKSHPGPQRGIIATNITQVDELNGLWEKIVGRQFPGETSNHHLGTMVGLLGSTYEMMMYGADYRAQIFANAKAFATALDDVGLNVFGDRDVGFTESHQVLLHVGNGPEVAKTLSENGIITNLQAGPGDEGTVDASYVRLVVQEMTRFGMKEADFGQVAALMKAAIEGNDVSDAVSSFREGFTVMDYCLPDDEVQEYVEMLRDSWRN